MGKVAKEVAEAEVNDWLDYKKIGEAARESYKDNIETISEAIAEGVLVLGTDKVLTHTLKFPTTGEAPLTELQYAPRINVGQAHKYLKGLKPGESEGRMVAYAAALTKKPKALIEALDMEDYKVTQAIVVFFL